MDPPPSYEQQQPSYEQQPPSMYPVPPQPVAQPGPYSKEAIGAQVDPYMQPSAYGAPPQQYAQPPQTYNQPPPPNQINYNNQVGGALPPAPTVVYLTPQQQIDQMRNNPQQYQGPTERKTTTILIIIGMVFFAIGMIAEFVQFIVNIASAASGNGVALYVIAMIFNVLYVALFLGAIIAGFVSVLQPKPKRKKAAIVFTVLAIIILGLKLFVWVLIEIIAAAAGISSIAWAIVNIIFGSFCICLCCGPQVFCGGAHVKDASKNAAGDSASVAAEIADVDPPANIDAPPV